MKVDSRISVTRAAGSKRPLVIGLTGPIAAGKSTVAALLRDRGAFVIDADQVYRSLLNPESDLRETIVAKFGAGVTAPDGQIDRAALGAIVFGEPDALAELEQITHPPVVAEIRRRIEASNADVVVVEAVKLVESGLLADVDSLWLVTADPEVRLRRLAASRGLDEPTARARLAASLDVAAPDAPVDVVIDNSRDMSCAGRAVANAWRAATDQLATNARQDPVAALPSKENA